MREKDFCSLFAEHSNRMERLLGNADRYAPGCAEEHTEMYALALKDLNREIESWEKIMTIVRKQT